MGTNNRTRFYLLWGIGIAVGIALVVLLSVLAVRHFLPEAEQPEGTTPVKELVCLQFSSYSGEFVEDGTDETVQNVAAILVENTGTEFLDRAEVVYGVGSKRAEFVVTGLPPGERAWVLESDRMILEEGDEFRPAGSTTSFRSNAITDPEDMQVTAQGDTLTLVNNSTQTRQNVCVYYKVRHTDGSFLGGITYMLKFGDLEPGQSVTRRSDHFSEKAEIVRYSYQTGQVGE